MTNTDYRSPTHLLGRPSSGHRLDSRVKLEVVIEHERPQRTVLFTLDRHLPGEPEGNYFRYGGVTVLDGSAVKNPKVAYCESRPVRNFLNGFAYYQHLLVLSFGLTQVELFYGMDTTYQKAVGAFVKACATALSLEDTDTISVLTLE